MEAQPARCEAILAFLQTLPLFEGTSPAGLAMLAKVSRWRRAAKGTYLFFQADPADVVFVVKTGAVAIRLDNPDGRELIINEMIAGECFGELGALTGQARSTSAEAIVESEMLVIPTPAFRA